MNLDKGENFLEVFITNGSVNELIDSKKKINKMSTHLIYKFEFEDGKVAQHLYNHLGKPTISTHSEELLGAFLSIADDYL